MVRLRLWTVEFMVPYTVCSIGTVFTKREQPTVTNNVTTHETVRCEWGHINMKYEISLVNYLTS